MTYTSKQLGKLRRDLVAGDLSLAQIRAHADALRIEMPNLGALRRKGKAAAAVLEVIGRPFDRAARDALRRRPVWLVQQTGTPRHWRRWRAITHNDILIGAKRRKKMVPPTMRWVTGAELDEQRAAVAS